ncbi:MAG: hypothetical protein ABWZ66_10145 [Pyrinomonadaceae bacterium]
MRKKGTGKKLIIEAFEKSESKTVTDVCRIAGIVRNTFYFHCRRDAEFRRQVLEIQREKLNKKLAAV